MPFKPGQSGNPAKMFKKGHPGGPGRPKKRPVTERYEHELEELISEEVRLKLGLKKGATRGDAMARSTVMQAIRAKSAQFAKEIREAIEGKSPQRLEITTPEDRDIKIRVTYDEE